MKKYIILSAIASGLFASGFGSYDTPTTTVFVQKYTNHDFPAILINAIPLLPKTIWTDGVAVVVVPKDGNPVPDAYSVTLTYQDSDGKTWKRTQTILSGQPWGYFLVGVAVTPLSVDVKEIVYTSEAA